MKRSIYWLMAAAAGVVVANNYYNQPLLAEFSHTFHATERESGLVPVAAQTGYALGLLLFVPLGDTIERRGLLCILLAVATASLVAIALSPTLGCLIAATFITGLSSVAPQLLTPFAAELAGAQHRGRAIGIVMFGLLCGILVSRTVAGMIAQFLGWRIVYWMAAVAMIITTIALSFALPKVPRTFAGSYGTLMCSLWALVRNEPLIRRTSTIGALQFAAFSAFWSTLAFHLHSLDAHYGSAIAGAFGLVGIVGALASTAAGRATDSRNPRFAMLVSNAIFIAAFAVFALTGHTVSGLVIGVILLDLGLQSGHVVNIAVNMGIRGSAMNRINTIYMTARFCGGALGSSAGLWAWSRWQWAGVCGFGLLAGSTSLAQQILLKSDSLCKESIAPAHQAED